MPTRVWYQFRVFLRYLVGRPETINRTFHIGTKNLRLEEGETIERLKEQAIYEVMSEQPHLPTLVKAGGAEVWAKVL